MHTTKKGFTLIELLVVIAIIGVLSSVVLASLNSARQKSRDAKRISDVKQLQLALELYFDAHRQYPQALTTANLVTPGYIATIPTDPVTGGTCTTGAEAGCYDYAALQGSGAVAATCASYHLGTTLEDKSHTALGNDIDAPATDAVCTGGGTNFDGGSDATNGVYDVKP
jgi:prepilin-type N-terminal cleavage/methylation domain-containing protein